MTEPIDFFDGTQYDFLSNFHPAIVECGGETYATTEHAYQAMKFLAYNQRVLVGSAATPGRAKMLGNTLRPLRADWEEVKVSIMRDLLILKFAQPKFAALLLETGDAELIEGNTWHDNYWGVCVCGQHKDSGLNWLGRLLMEVREWLLSTS